MEVIKKMPGSDRTGPVGRGPMTGRAAGFCAGYPSPGYSQRFGRGWGRGMGRGFWGRGRRYWDREYFNPPINQLEPHEEKIYLENLIKNLENELQEVKNRLQELSKEKKEP